MPQQNLLSRKNNLSVYIGSTLFFIYTFTSLILYSPIVLLCMALPFPIRYKAANLWAISITYAAKIFCHLNYHIDGLENLPKNKAYIVLSKHQSAWETLSLRVFLPMQTTVLKKSLTQIPLGGWALLSLKPIAIDRNEPKTALRILIEQGTARLKEGLIVVVFPEGTRAAPGEDKKFNIGGAMLAQKSEFPVIPLAHNAGEFWPRYSFLKYPGTITVKIGPVIESTGKKAKEINAEAEAWIAQAMKEISLTT